MKSIAFPVSIFIQSWWTVLCADLLHKISSYTGFHSLDNKLGNYVQKFTDTPKHCFHCTNFLKFPQWQYAQIFCTEFTQSGQEKRKECVQINLFPELEYNDHSWLSKTHACSMAFSKELPQQISWKFDTWLVILGQRQMQMVSTYCILLLHIK